MSGAWENSGGYGNLWGKALAFSKVVYEEKKTHIKFDNAIIPFCILIFCTRSGNGKCYNAWLQPCVGPGWDDLIMGS